MKAEDSLARFTMKREDSLGPRRIYSEGRGPTVKQEDSLGSGRAHFEVGGLTIKREHPL